MLQLTSLLKAINNNIYKAATHGKYYENEYLSDKSSLGHFMIKVALGDFSIKKFLASIDIFTSIRMLESIVRQIKLVKGEEWCNNKSGNDEIHCMHKNKKKYIH